MAISADEFEKVGELGAKIATLKAQIEQLISGASEKKTLPASPAFDVWSFGVVMFEMCTGTRLFNRSNEDDLHTDAEKLALVNWQGLPQESCAQILKHVLCTTTTDDDREAATELITWCLRKEPSTRPTMTEVLNHPFLHGSEADMQRLLKNTAAIMGTQCVMRDDLQEMNSNVSALREELQQAKVSFQYSTSLFEPRCNVHTHILFYLPTLLPAHAFAHAQAYTCPFLTGFSHARHAIGGRVGFSLVLHPGPTRHGAPLPLQQGRPARRGSS
jgi:serine/threonine protein kinase